MSDLLFNRVYAFLREQQLLRPDALCIVAVSGGPDSLCLLHVLRRIHAEGGPALHVAHLDHGFRGAQSAAEAQFVAQTAHAWGLSATVAYQDVPAMIRRFGQNRQATARAARYAFLARVAHATQAAAVAVAHQADDQAETVLMHLLRGAGPAGLRGMRALLPWAEWAAAETETPGAPPLIRPLLTTTRAEIASYCAEHSLAAQDDPSNHVRTYTRSRIRAELLPRLTTYNPQIVAALGRSARICADDYAYIQDQVAQHWPTLAETWDGAIGFRVVAWATLPVVLRRYALRRAVLQLNGRDDLSYEQIEAACLLAERRTGRDTRLGAGIMLHVAADWIVLRRDDAAFPAQARPAADETLPQLDADEIALAIPSTVPISSSWRAEVTLADPTPCAAARRWWVALDRAALDGPLALRRRRPGDRFRPAGGRGSRSLQDFFVDHKLPRELRAAWPVLATAQSIVWVAGLRADARFQAGTATRQTIWVGLTRRKE